VIHWSGQNWYLRPEGWAPTISVIEAPQESYDAYHERMKREESGKKVPFGFARELDAPVRKPPAKRRKRS
jgi:hypothetical protein